jgi:aquaporin Z
MKKYASEFIGTFFLVLVIGMTVNNGAGAMAPIAIGMALMALVYAGGHISGAHYNPAVTLAIYLRKKMDRKDVLPYMAAQLAGSGLAALTTGFLLDGKMPLEAAPVPDIVRAFTVEMLGTFALVYVVLNVATAKAVEGNNYYGLAIGLTVTGIAYAFGGISGGAFNPAVVLGLGAMKMLHWSSAWIFLVSNFPGAILATLVFRLTHPEE